MNTHEQKKLSESLLQACKAAGIEEPKYFAQDANGNVFHYSQSKPKPQKHCEEWDSLDRFFKQVNHPPYADDWQESLLEFREYALIRTCDKCQAITAIDMVGSDANEKELQCEGETVFRVSKEEALGAVIKLCKCACGVENFNITKAAAMAKWRDSFAFTETEKRQIDALADEPIKTLAGKSKEWFEQSAIAEGDLDVSAGLANLQSKAEYALIRTCDKCKAITLVEMIGSEQNEREMQYKGETVLRVSKEEANQQVDKLAKCNCGARLFVGEFGSDGKPIEIKELGMPLADVLARHPEHIADTSKMVDACEFEAMQAENERAKWIMRQLLNDLPRQRDWLDPDIEREMKAMTEKGVVNL